MPASLYVSGGERMIRLGEKLAAAGPGMRRAVRAALREATKPVVRDIRNEMLAESLKVVAKGSGGATGGASGSHGGGRGARLQYSLDRRKGSHSGLQKIPEKTMRRLAARSSLRQTIAAGTGVSIGLTAVPSVTIRVNNTFLPADQKTLPRAIEGGEWRHPVFGRPGVWVAQQGNPYFYPPIHRKLPEIVAKVEAVAITFVDAEVTHGHI